MKDVPMSLVEHLEELRVRLIVVLTAVTTLACVSYAFVDRVIDLMARSAGGFVFFSPAEAFLVRLKVSLMLGAFIAVPLIIYEAWRFIGVALAPSERRLVFSILPASYALFVAGAACAWLLVIPTATRFLLGFATDNLIPMMSLEAYIGFVSWLTAAFGVMFQLPILVVFLVKSGIASPDTLAAYRRHVLLGLAVLAAFFTPGPDFFSQMALLVPPYLLFELSLLITRWTCSIEDASVAR